jgi:glycosyltransferase involved in cell wall biosynthesis
VDILWLRPDKPENISVGRSQIAEKLEQKGHTVDVQGTSLRSFRTALNENPDVIVGTTRLGAFVGTWMKLIKRLPLVIDHIDPVSQFRRNNGRLLTWSVSQAEKFSFRCANHVMVVYEEEVPRVKWHTDSVTKTRLGVDYERFTEPDSEIIRDATDILSDYLDINERILIYIGGLEPPYYVPTVIEAMEYLPDWHFVVLGDGSQRPVVEKASNEMENAHYLGTVPHETVSGFLHVSDVGISLVDDRNSLKILEYGAAGLPVVSVEGDPENLFKSMVEFCRLNQEDIAETTRRAYERGTSEELRELTRNHSWERVADEYEEVFRKVAQ